MKIMIMALLLLAVASTGKVEFKLSPTSNVTAVFLTCCGRYDLLTKTLKYFAKSNDYPLHSVIVVNDGPLIHPLQTALADTPTVTLLNTGVKVGQVIAIDLAYSLVKTPYVYFSEDDMWLIEKGLIQMNIEKLEADPTLLQVWNNKAFHPKITGDDGYISPEKLVFSFNPSVNRMDLYRQLPGGYAGITKNSSYGLGAGKAEDQINDYYKPMKKYHVWQSPRKSILHAGERRGAPRSEKP